MLASTTSAPELTQEQVQRQVPPGARPHPPWPEPMGGKPYRDHLRSPIRRARRA